LVGATLHAGAVGVKRSGACPVPPGRRTTAPPGRGGMVTPMPRVILMRGGLHHRFYDLSGRTRVGAHPDNDIVVDGDRDVSRWHCTISESKGRWMVRDKGSRTGTFLNGTHVTEASLRFGDRIRVGQTVVLFVPD